MREKEIDEITLTDDTLTNIYIMAPYLTDADQNKVFGMIFGLIGNRKKIAGIGEKE